MLRFTCWGKTSLCEMFLVIPKSPVCCRPPRRGGEPSICGESGERRINSRSWKSLTGRYDILCCTISVVWHCGPVVDTRLLDQKVQSSNPGFIWSTFSPWERLLTCFVSPHSGVK